MSFTSNLKQELGALPLTKPCCMTAELSALTACCASLSLYGRGRYQVGYASFSVGVIKRTFTLLRQRFGLKALPSFNLHPRFGGRRHYQLQLSAEDSGSLIKALNPTSSGQGNSLRGVPRRVVRRICCRRAWIRGVFMGCGSMLDPQRGYRAEFVPPDKARADYLVKLLALSGITARRSVRRGREIVYLRDGDSIVTLLSLMGASRSVLSMENVRAANSIRENVNRATNCDQANVSKQLLAAQLQTEKIVGISLSRGLSALPKDLEQLARLRLSNPDAGLKELAALSVPPLSKSGVQHRMRRIMAFGEDGRTD